ncbi:Nucleic acid-binding, OB-fold [Sesbania bispinosa]|nr:Nucleic acid-binding, OB-fold [Sesbania bispinosa]
MLENLSVALNSGKYKPTMHEFRMFFKRETRVTLVEDSSIPLYGFSFVPFVEILNETKDDRHVLGVVTGKGNLIEFKKEGKPCNYVGGLKLRCTLWEDYAFMFLKHLEDHPSESYVVVLQFAKMKNFKGSVGVSNTTYNSKLFINANIPEIEDFQMRLKSSDSQQGIQFSQLSDHASLTLEEEFLERGVYKSIADLKENSVFVTIGTVKDIESEYNWCYRACSINSRHSELLSQFTESSDLLKDNLSVSCDNGVDTPSPLLPTGKTASNMDSSVIKVLDVDLAEYCGNASFDTPSKCKGEMHSEQTIVRVAVHGDEQSAKKLRKVIKEEKN